jgi:hypothetical protein
MAASKWYNFHLLFDAAYGDVTGMKKARLILAFKLFMYAAALKLLIRARSFDVFAAAQGIAAAKAACRLYRGEHNVHSLLCGFLGEENKIFRSRRRRHAKPRGGD